MLGCCFTLSSWPDLVRITLWRVSHGLSDMIWSHQLGRFWSRMSKWSVPNGIETLSYRCEQSCVCVLIDQCTKSSLRLLLYVLYTDYCAVVDLRCIYWMGSWVVGLCEGVCVCVRGEWPQLLHLAWIWQWIWQPGCCLKSQWRPSVVQNTRPRGCGSVAPSVVILAWLLTHPFRSGLKCQSCLSLKSLWSSKPTSWEPSGEQCVRRRLHALKK